jgi:hypothetical protein
MEERLGTMFLFRCRWFRSCSLRGRYRCRRQLRSIWH